MGGTLKKKGGTFLQAFKIKKRGGLSPLCKASVSVIRLVIRGDKNLKKTLKNLYENCERRSKGGEREQCVIRSAAAVENDNKTSRLCVKSKQRGLELILCENGKRQQGNLRLGKEPNQSLVEKVRSGE